MRSLARRHSRVILWAAGALVLLGAFGFWLRTSSLVRVKQVTVTGIEGRGAGAIRDALIAEARDMTTLAVDDDALRRAVSSYPVVRSLRTSVDFPHRLRIDVNAYEPVAAVRRRGGAATAVAGDGRLLRGTPTRGLALVTLKASAGSGRVGDAGALSAIRVVAAAPAPLRDRLEHVYRGPRGLVATVHDGPKLYFGSDRRAQAKWSAIARVLADDSSRGATYVDVRIPDRPVAGGFQPRPTELSPSTLG